MTIEQLIEKLGDKFARLKYNPRAGLWQAVGRGVPQENQNTPPFHRTQALSANEALQKLLESYQ